MQKNAFAFTEMDQRHKSDFRSPIIQSLANSYTVSQMKSLGESDTLSSHLVVFDVEGVLLPKRRFLPFEVGTWLGTLTFLKIFTTGILYAVGLLSIESTLRRLFRFLEGMPIEELFKLYRKLPLMPGAVELFDGLRALGFRTALISSGLPGIFVEDLARRLGADYASGFEVEVENGRLTGRIWGNVIKREGKAVALREIVCRDGSSWQNCVVVADDRNNLPLLDICELGIGFNPDFILSFKSDFVVKEDLLEILPILSKSKPVHTHTLSSRVVFRELIHVGGILVPFICMYFLNTYVVASILLVVSLYSASELLRLFGTNLPFISTITLKAAARSELHEFATAPIYYALGIVLSLLLFPQPASYASIAVLAFGDSFAALFGRKHRGTVFPFNKGKSVEASLFGWFFALLGSCLFVDPVRALIGASAGLLAECLPLPVDDNLAIPLTSGLALTLTL